MVLGTGWAPHRGGPLHYADRRGLAEVVAALTDLTTRSASASSRVPNYEFGRKRTTLSFGPSGPHS